MGEPGRPVSPSQEIRFCRAPDGVRIAYAVHGTGPPLVISTCWLSHLQHDWESPVWRHFLADIGRFATVIRFDERGHGLSDWDVDDFSLEARLGDLEAVVEHSGVTSFALMGMAQGGPPSILYAARHPERVTRLVFYGSYLAPEPNPTPEVLELRNTFAQMIKVGWARPDSAFRRVFTSLMIPGATEEQMRWLDELQRVAVSATTAHASYLQRMRADARAEAALLRLPTLVLHASGDQMNEFDFAVDLAAAVEGARLVPLESPNHIVLEHEPAWQVFLAELEEFLAGDRAAWALPQDPAASAQLDELTPRELEVLRLAADGRDNDAIATDLQLSARTVERHLQNVYLKLGFSGRSARTAAVARLLTR